MALTKLLPKIFLGLGSNIGNRKENLKRYLNNYKMITDGLNIVDGYVINFAIEFDVTALTGYNRREVLRI